MHYSFLMLALLQVTGTQASWGGEKTKSVRTRQRTKNRAKSCVPFSINPAISKLPPIERYGKWALEYDLDVRGLGSVEVWLDLDGSGTFEGLEDNLPDRYKVERPVHSGEWELVHRQVVSREDGSIHIVAGGNWGDALPVHDMDMLVRACETVCIYKGSAKCQEYRYTLPLAGTLQGHKVVQHEAQGGIPAEIVSGTNIVPTTGYIIGGVVSGFMVLIAGGSALWRLKRASPKIETKAGQTADDYRVQDHL